MRGPSYSENELVILTLLALIVITIIAGVLGFVIYRVHKAFTPRGPGNAPARVEPYINEV